MLTPDRCDQAQSVTLGAFLKRLRIRIHCEVRALGPHGRLPSRWGKPVTQEEIAEAVDVSRGWYCRLESDVPTRASMRLLNRLADVLMLSADERVRLFQLAVPEVQHVGLRDDSVAVLEAFSRMGGAAKRLWAATSESEALDEASEALATWFPDVLQIGSARRLDVGVWDTRLLEPPINSTKRFEEFVRELGASVATAEDLDEVFVFPQLVQPGETGLVLQLFSPLIREAKDDALARCGLGRGSVDCFDARVRSGRGLIACLGLFQENGRPFSETDQAILSTVAQLTSLALS